MHAAEFDAFDVNGEVAEQVDGRGEGDEFGAERGEEDGEDEEDTGDDDAGCAEARVWFVVSERVERAPESFCVDDG